MTRRMTEAQKAARLQEAYDLACERATHFRLARRTGAGELLTGFKMFEATGVVRRRNLIEKGARPVLPSSAWRAIYEEVGLS